MKLILLIGLGRFGKYIAMNLNQLGYQILAVDHREERVDEILPYVTNAQIGDSTNEEFLKSLGVRTRWSIRRNSWRNGRPFGAAPTTFWITWSWTRNTLCLRSQYRSNGPGIPLDRLTSGGDTM